MATATKEIYLKAYMTEAQKKKLSKFAKKEGKAMSTAVCEALKKHLG